MINIYIPGNNPYEGRALVNYSLSDGIKRNNPGNIRRSASFAWQGEINRTPFTPGFAVFSSLAYGYRAMIKLLQNYVKGGTNTLRTIIYKYAPPFENDSANYVRYVSMQTGLSPDSVIASSDLVTLSRIALAMSQMEHGQQAINAINGSSEISQALALLNNNTPGTLPATSPAPQYATASSSLGIGILSALIIGGMLLKKR